MDDSLSFEPNENVDYARKTLYKADKEFFPDYGIISGSTSASSIDDPQIVHIFLQQSDFERITEKKKTQFFEFVCQKFKEADLELLEENDLDGYTYFHIGFYSHHYMLKKTQQ